MSRSLPSFEHENAFSMLDSEQVVELQDQGTKYVLGLFVAIKVFSPLYFILNYLSFPSISLRVID
jgi:hypothetical protein